MRENWVLKLGGALRLSRYLEDKDEIERVWNAHKIDLSRPILDLMKKRAGVRSLAALYRNAGSVDLIWTNKMIELEPHRHLGGERWALFENRETLKFPETVSDDELGTALLTELEVSRNGSYEGT